MVMRPHIDGLYTFINISGRDELEDGGGSLARKRRLMHKEKAGISPLPRAIQGVVGGAAELKFLGERKVGERKPINNS